MTPILSIQDLSYAYAQKPVLTNVQFEMGQGDFVAVIGPNGGGKSTFIKLIMGLIQPDSGTIRLFGEPVESGRRLVGYLPQFQNVDLDYPILVEEVVLMSLLQGNWLRSIRRKDRQLAWDVLEKVGILHLKDRPLSALSGGEKQRVFLARALVNQPKLLILDEPTTSVDIQAEQSLYRLLQDLHQSLAILMVSHDLSAVSQLVNKIACLNQKMVFHQTKELTAQDLEEVYGCPVALIAHGVPHHHLESHG